MISFIGLFSTNYPFPDEVPVPSPEDLDTLPPRFRSIASQELPPNEDDGFYLNQLMRERRPLSSFSLFRLAQQERRVAEAISKPFIFTQWLCLTFKIKSMELKIGVKSKVKQFKSKSERKRLKRAIKQKVLSLFTPFNSG